MTEDVVCLTIMKQYIVNLVTCSKASYQARMGDKLAQGAGSSKQYWNTLKMLINNDAKPVVPALIENDVLIVDAEDKAELLNNFFADQCTPILTSSNLPVLHSCTEANLTDVNFTQEKITTTIRALNPKKAHGWDDMLARIIKYRDAFLARYPFQKLS